MHIVIFGATGYVGRHVAVRCLAEGHTVSALVRNEAGAQSLAGLGVQAQVGSLDDLTVDSPLLTSADAVIWAAQLMHDDERRVVGVMLDALKGTGKTFIFTGGASLLSRRTDGDWYENTFAEDDDFTPRRQIAPRLLVEALVREAAGYGVRSMSVRPPLIWGNGGSKVISDLYHSARATGSVCYVGRGLNVYSSVHVEDLADLYVKALEKGVAGALYHCVSGELNYRSMAEGIARHLGIGTRSITVEEAMQVWDRFTGPIVFSSCSRTISPRARAELGWIPREDRLDILEDCAHPAYSAEAGRPLPAWVKPAV